MTPLTIKPYFFDTEFDETLPEAHRFASIGMVDMQGHEYYRASRAFRQASASPWVRQHVVPLLPPFENRRSIVEIAGEVQDYFIISLRDTHPSPKQVEFWGRNPASDTVNLCNLFGTQLKLKEFFRKQGIERVDFRDIKELTRYFTAADQPRQDPKTKHHALQDARHERHIWQTLVELADKRHMAIK
jgi:hypothetical protein